MMTLELTPAELEMIQVKREKEELAKKEAELAKQAELEKDIARKEQNIVIAQKEDAAQVAKAQEFLNQLPKGWTIDIRTWEDKAVVNEYTKTQTVTLWSKTFDRQSASLKFEDVKVWVELYNREWRMQISGNSRYYTRVSTVAQKVQDMINEKKAVVELAKKKLDAQATVAEQMREKYPDAKVEVGVDYEKVSKGRQHYDYEKYNAIMITFPCGAYIKYKVYSDGSLGQMALKFPDIKDQWELMDALNSMGVKG
jgi:hypothetical protein